MVSSTNGLIQAVERFKQNYTVIGKPDELTEEGEEYKSLLQSFIRLYSFLSQVIDWQDAELEKLYAYGRLLVTKLPYRTAGGRINLDDELDIEAYRNEITFEGSAALAIGESEPVYGPHEVGTGRMPEEKRSPLSEILEKINDRMGIDGDWSENDFTPFYQVSQDMAENRIRLPIKVESQF